MRPPMRQLALLAALINQHTPSTAPMARPGPAPHAARTGSAVALDDLAVLDIGVYGYERRGGGEADGDAVGDGGGELGGLGLQVW